MTSQAAGTEGSTSTRLPDWREHGGNRKLEPLGEAGKAPEPVVREFLGQVAHSRGGDRSSLRVLDLGCGRGALVSWLLQEGWNAWGADISADYVAAGSDLTGRLGGGEARLRVIDGPSLPFDEPFDVVLSDQVLEHVEDLDLFASQIAGASRPGTVGLHILPARWAPIEPHMKLPVVHWLPKGPVRRAAIKAMLGAGLGVDHFKDLRLDDRTTVFNAFSEEETFYRGYRELASAFQRVGITCDFRSAPLRKFELAKPGLPKPLAIAGSIAYGHLRATYIETRSVQDPERPPERDGPLGRFSTTSSADE